MEDRDLERLLTDLESDLVERKESGRDKDRICQAICAFANDLPNHGKPGVVFIGGRDDGSCVGLAVTDELLLSLADLRSNGNIYPFPSITVQKGTLGGGEYAVILAFPSDFPPVRYRGRTWIRVGPRRAIATEEEERRLIEKRRARDLPFDIRPVPSAGIEDLDQEWFRGVYLPSALPEDVLASNERSLEQQLAALRFAGLGPDARPTVLGMLACGLEPTRYIPGGYVQFVRFDGERMTDPIRHEKQLAGPLPDQLRRLDELFEANISVAVDATSRPVERRHPDFPLVALQQLARNALMHRTYEGTHAPVRVSWFTDRIEIHNPGGPFGQVNRHNFGRPGLTDYRNPNLAEVMGNLGYVQRFGIGIPLARKALEDNGNPPPEFQVEDAHVLVIIKACR